VQAGSFRCSVSAQKMVEALAQAKQTCIFKLTPRFLQDFILFFPVDAPIVFFLA